MKLREKTIHLKSFMSDIYVIQECEDPDRVQYPAYSEVFTSHVWKGKNKSKGLGVFCANGVKVDPIELNDDGLDLFLPCKTSIGINLLAVWTKNKTELAPAYIGQFWTYYERHRKKFQSNYWLILGDFNSNAVWDRVYRPGHSFVMAELAKDHFISAYHNEREKKIKHGYEPDPTSYMYRKKENPYHVDYVFHKSGCSHVIQDFQIGTYEDWGDISDHMPINLNLKLGER